MPYEEKFKELKEKHKRPKNVDNLRIPAVDNTLRRVLERQTRAVDLQLQRETRNLDTCMVPVLKIIDSLQSLSSNTKKDLKQVKELAGDIQINVPLCQGELRITQRKNKKKEKNLKPRVKSILKDTTATATQLFWG